MKFQNLNMNFNLTKPQEKKNKSQNKNKRKLHLHPNKEYQKVLKKLVHIVKRKEVENNGKD